MRITILNLGAYLDPEFWKSFLKPFMVAGLNYVNIQRYKIWPGNQPSNNAISSGNQTSEREGIVLEIDLPTKTKWMQRLADPRFCAMARAKIGS